MTAAHIDFAAPYTAFERAALEELAGERGGAFLAELGQHVDHVIDGGALEPVLDCSERLDRLAANLHGNERASGYLTAVLQRLDRNAASLAQERDIQARREAALGVRERVLAWVAEHPRTRSSDIAEGLGVAPSQASRALRELQQRGEVFLAAPTPAEHDRREHRYTLASASSAHAA